MAVCCARQLANIIAIGHVIIGVVVSTPWLVV
jgi:hypothetical protein